MITTPGRLNGEAGIVSGWKILHPKCLHENEGISTYIMLDTMTTILHRVPPSFRSWSHLSLVLIALPATLPHPLRALHGGATMDRRTCDSDPAPPCCVRFRRHDLARVPLYLVHLLPDYKLHSPPAIHPGSAQVSSTPDHKWGVANDLTSIITTIFCRWAPFSQSSAFCCQATVCVKAPWKLKPLARFSMPTNEILLATPGRFSHPLGSIV